MRKVTPEELLDLAAYEANREALRARIIAHKKQRRVLLGPEMSLLFEDHETVKHQVHEMLRAERITDPSAVRAEVETYNDLVAPAGSLLATLMIECADAQVREMRRRDLDGLDDHLHLSLGDVQVRGVFDPAGRSEGRTAVVRYVSFALPPEGRARLLDRSVAVRLGCTHPRYGYSVELGEEIRQSLARDLSDPRDSA